MRIVSMRPAWLTTGDMYAQQARRAAAGGGPVGGHRAGAGGLDECLTVHIFIKKEGGRGRGGTGGQRREVEEAGGKDDDGRVARVKMLTK